MKLYNHQQKIIDRNPARFLLAHGTGTGKSITALELAKGRGVSTLVIVPKSLKENWERYLVMYGAKNSRVITKETFRSTFQVLPAFQAIIVDEAHYFSGSSLMTKSLRAYIKKNQVPYIWQLTATPYLSTPWNIYNLGVNLGMPWNYIDWKRKYFSEIRMGNRLVPVVKKGIEADMRKHVLEIGDTVSLEDCIDVPPQIDETVYFEMTPEQKKAISLLQDTEHITRWTHTHTIENGVLKSDGYTQTQIFECLKSDYIASLAEQNPKIAIFCRYKDQIAHLAEHLKNLKKQIFIITGDTKDRDKIVQEVENSTACIVLISAGCSEGYELPSIPVVVFASLSFSYKDYVQSKGRFLRINKPKKNVFIHLVIKDGVDSDVFDCIMKKQDFSFSVYGKTSSYGKGKGLSDTV